MGVVTVFLDKITDLKDSDGMGKSDPYCKLHLEKDNWGPLDKDHGTQTSSKKGNTCNPEYAETFSFHDVPSLESLVLHVTVYDDDVLKDDKIGSVTIKLADINGDLSDFQEVVEKLDNKWFRKDAKVHLKIKFEG